MALGATYELRLNDSFGHILTYLPKPISLEYARSTNSVTDLLTLTLPPTFGITQLQVDGSIEVMRRADGGSRILDLETQWLIRNINPVVQKSGESFVIVKCEATSSLLRRRIVAYADGSSQANKTMAADDLLKQVVLENFGASAGASRDWTSAGFQIAPSTAQAPSITKAFAYTPVSQVCTEVAQYITQGDTVNSITATPFYFDIAVITASNPALPAIYEFRTYLGQRGVNHGASSDSPVVFDIARDNISEASREWDYLTEQNVIYAGGPGSGSDRTVLEVGNTTGIARSRFNRCEGFVNATDATVAGAIAGGVDALKLAAEGNAALQSNRAKRHFWATVQDAPGCLRGVHWNYGDVVQVVLGDSTDEYRVEAVKVKLDSNGETCDVRLESLTPL
jgi:hypothetical protein